MYKNKTLGVVVPAYNEEVLIEKTILTMPDFVDKIIVVDDASKDKTLEIVKNFSKANSKIVVVSHQRNNGLGKSLIDGYLKSLELKMDVVAVMAGDAQMDPADLAAVVDPVVSGRADYAKGDRLVHADVTKVMPKFRLIGNAFLTLMTKFATGYWRIIDPQCGYTAISGKTLRMIPITKMIRGYGYNAHLLYMLNIVNAKVEDVEVKPVYGSEKSRIRLESYIPKVFFLLFSLFIKRIFYKYLFREFHPLVFFYLFSFANIVLISVPLTVRFFYLFSKQGIAPTTTLILLTFCFSMGFFSFFFGMWLDMEDNKRLQAS